MGQIQHNLYCAMQLALDRHIEVNIYQRIFCVEFWKYLKERIKTIWFQILDLLLVPLYHRFLEWIFQFYVNVSFGITHDFDDSYIKKRDTYFEYDP